jgi:hypothetical protein
LVFIPTPSLFFFIIYNKKIYGGGPSRLAAPGTILDGLLYSVLTLPSSNTSGPSYLCITAEVIRGEQREGCGGIRSVGGEK